MNREEERRRFESWFSVAYPLFGKDAERNTTLKHQLWTCWQVAAIKTESKNEYSRSKTTSS